MADYYIRERQDLNHEGETIETYEVRSRGTVDLRQLAHQVSRKYRAISESELEGIAVDFLDEMLNVLAMGYGVTLGRLGNFSLRIGLKDEVQVEDVSRHNSRSLCVRSLKFSPGKEFVRELDRKCKLTSEGAGVQRLHHSPYTRDQRIQRAVAFLKEHHLMRLDDYVAINGLSRSAASKELREIDHDASSSIHSDGSGVSKVFVLKNLHEE